MDTAADHRGPGPAPQSESREGSLVEPLERMLVSLRRIAADYATLAVLDMRRAAVQLVWLVGAGILVAVLVVTAWLAGVVALAVWLIGSGMSWPAVLGIAALLNLLGAALVLLRVKGVFEHAPFSATLRQIAGESHEK